jgi:hypothetical protein
MIDSGAKRLMQTESNFEEKKEKKQRGKADK